MRNFIIENNGRCDYSGPPEHVLEVRSADPSVKMALEDQKIKGSGSYSFYTGGLCRDCKHWDISKGYDTGQCHEIAADLTVNSGTQNQIRVYDDSIPVSTEPCFGCNHFMKKIAGQP